MGIIWHEKGNGGISSLVYSITRITRALHLEVIVTQLADQDPSNYKIFAYLLLSLLYMSCGKEIDNVMTTSLSSRSYSSASPLSIR